MKCICEMKIKGDLLDKIKTQYPDFKLTHLYEYKFLTGLTYIRMEKDDFYEPQQGPYMWNYFLESFTLQEMHNSNLKGLFESTALREKCLYWELLWSSFSRIQTEYGHFLRSATKILNAPNTILLI